MNTKQNTNRIIWLFIPTITTKLTLAHFIYVRLLLKLLKPKHTILKENPSVETYGNCYCWLFSFFHGLHYSSSDWLIGRPAKYISLPTLFLMFRVLFSVSLSSSPLHSTHLDGSLQHVWIIQFFIIKYVKNHPFQAWCLHIFDFFKHIL